MKLTPQVARKYSTRYYEALKKYKHHHAGNEGTTETAFKMLLHSISMDLNLTLVKTSSPVNDQNNIIPDGIIKDDYFRVIGYWEAKDEDDELDKEIYKKLQKGYPRTNTIFEDTEVAVLYQNNSEYGRFELSNEDELVSLLIQFFNYNEPVYEQFRVAVEKFKENISRLATDFKSIISKAKSSNSEFKTAVAEFLEICQKAFHNDISAEDIEDMLIQHLLTERIFRKAFDNPDFTAKNVIAIQLEKLVTILTKHSFNKAKYFQAIDPYYVAIEQEASTFSDFSEKQSFLNKIYEAFFQSYSKKSADRNGIVYTPQSIVKFMVKFSESILKNEFGKTFSSKGVEIIDPCTGTGNFVIEILRNIDKESLPYKYNKEIFANEIMLLPYYVASANIEHFYFEKTGNYEPFENIVFTDTLELVEDPRKQDSQQGFDFFFNEANSERARRELDSNIFVIIGNPPYNASQENENQNNKNTKNKIIDPRISETYAEASNAQLKNKLYDPYVKFFRWAGDRLNSQNGIICFVSNNSFMSDIQFDGMRSHLFKDFNRIYHFDLGGDIYSNPKLSGTKHNVFGIKVGVGITFLIRHSNYSDHKIFYRRLDEYISREEKEDILSGHTKKNKILDDLDWQEGYLDISNNFTFDPSTIAAAREYDTFIPLFQDDENKKGYFSTKYPGINTARNEWVYDFFDKDLESKMRITTAFYNKEVERLERHIKEKRISDLKKIDIDSFVDIVEDKIKWSAGLKQQLLRLKHCTFSKSHVSLSGFRPFVKKYLYNDKIFVDRPSNFAILEQTENLYLLFSGLGSKKVSPFISNCPPNFDLLEKTQAFPLKNVEEVEVNGSIKVVVHDNISASVVDDLRKKLKDPKIKSRDVFYYVYGILHHIGFQNKYNALFRSSSPRIPLIEKHFQNISNLGKNLAELHLGFENSKEVKLKPTKQTIQRLRDGNKINYSVDKMKISRDQLILTYNNDLQYDIPNEAWGYTVNGRTPLEWIVDQYRDYKTDSDELIRLIGKCIWVTSKSNEVISELSKIRI